ncbi:5'/3'-nucleotidase SurE [Nitratiruptor tergarcus]|uniref:5'-nucleotidase SurE n=1 Tax=Nitratiruptor tergarcus DSM 16512 TaxID=1069081 RepID=A0A1W1WVH0_9BACT|nr:5'/3'-nucleotidase SurE [Nitratiruptor tergarcus]SMC10030.1 5'-nucleotidase /3'-nucleotidase /exopolyphosphatase [Nitratiruptor tergarcus DSM 16512]
MRRILITNDDGFESLGLQALIEAVKDLGEILVVVPASEKSACGHSLTLTKPLRFVELADNFYKLEDGTPSDCVYLALHALYPDGIKPDLILSGINRGANMGEDITYSGTVAGAMEAALYDIPAVALSQVCNSNCEETEIKIGYDNAKKVAREIAQKILHEGFPLERRKLLNINIPPVKNIKGYKITKAGYRLYANEAHLHRNPRGLEYWWLGLHPLEWERSEARDCDFEAVYEGYVSITPIKADLTAYEELNKLKNWL